MTNKDIITLVNGGFLVATAHSLPVEHFYKWHKFRRAVDKANTALGAQQRDLMADCGIDPARAGEADAEAVTRFNETNARLVAEDAGIEVKARIPFQFYKGIYDENKTERGDIFADVAVEAIILDNLFGEPEEGGSDE